MPTSPMTDWTVTYDNRASGNYSSGYTRVNVYAAYYVVEDKLVEFKDSRHQVVFALSTGVIMTIQRVDAEKMDGAAA